MRDALDTYVKIYKDELELMGEDEMEEEDDEEEAESDASIEIPGLNDVRTMQNASIGSQGRELE